MPELRWSLLIVGLLVVVGVYLYSRRFTRPDGDDGDPTGTGRAEPVISGEDLWGNELDGEPEGPAPAARPEARRTAPAWQREQPFTAHPAPYPEPEAEPELEPEPEPEYIYGGSVGAHEPEAAPDSSREPTEGPAPDPERIVAMRVAAPAGRTLSAEEMVLKLRELGLRHGRYGIFHRHEGDGQGRPLFSVASMTEPGSFDLTTLRETRLPGVSLFMVLPGPADPVAAFDSMVQVARELASELEGDILDESGSTWSIQRERYVREDLIRYRLQYPQR